MRTITFSHYTVGGIEAGPWKETWENLENFAGRFAPKLAPMDIKLKLRRVVMDGISQEALMTGNMVTAECRELGVPETPIENMLMLEQDFEKCESCVTPQGTEFPCRSVRDSGGKACLALPEGFFVEAALLIAFRAHQRDGRCSGCGCEDEAKGRRR